MANTFLRFPEGKAKALTLSYDDGVEQDIRLIEIMNQNKLKGTFNLNSGLYSAEGAVFPPEKISRRMTQKKATEIYTGSGHEIAIHALTHPFLEQLPSPMVVNEIIKDRNNLEKQFGTIVRGMAYPFGTYSDSVVEILRQCGIVYSRTVQTTSNFSIPTDWLRLKATCHHNCPELMTLAKKFTEDIVNRSPYLFYLWGHSYEFDIHKNWNVIEEFAQYTGNRDDVWYATNIEIYDYIYAYNQLIFSAEGTLVKNPTCMKIWINYTNETVEIKPGETKKL